MPKSINYLNNACTDIDECQEGLHSCRQVCVNTNGSYECACKEGYSLRNDGSNCRGINHCASKLLAPMYRYDKYIIMYCVLMCGFLKIFMLYTMLNTFRGDPKQPLLRWSRSISCCDHFAKLTNLQDGVAPELDEVNFCRNFKNNMCSGIYIRRYKYS